jgi:hypothetical protein
VAFGAAAVEDLLGGGEVVDDLEGDGVGEGDGEGDGVGEDEGDGESGSAWHTGLAAAAAFPWEATWTASALPGRPRTRKPVLRAVIAAARTCPKRMRIARLR